MNKNLVYLCLLLLVSVASCSFTNKSFENPDKDKLLIDLISYVLDRAHYNPKDINDQFSQKVFDNFIETIDPTKRYFLNSDIEEFNKYRLEIDDQIKNTDISFFNLVHDRLNQRMNEAKKIYQEVLDKPFNFTKSESINIDYKNQEFVSNKKALKERWRLQLKYASIDDYGDKLDDKESKKSKKEIEKEVRLSTKETLDEFFDFVDDLNRKDWFSQYINSIVEGFDPHTFYFAPQDKERFDMRMSGQFEGIGARLVKRRGQIKITEVISGGPVWRGNLLQVGDEITKVAQEKEEAVNVVGMRLDDAVKLIKGPKGTKVILTVKRVNGLIEEVAVVRDVVVLEESYAKSAKVNDGNKTYGIINLPSFYANFKDYDQKNAAADVKEEIIRLKKQGMDGLILDLRDNGGGSLKTVVDMAGLFIEDGPIVQVLSTGNRKKIHEDKDERIFWDGPLVVMVNELSASASEILAAAMQDYKRGIVLGSKQTFGKGTVQNVLELDGLVRNNEHGKLGALKLTIQKFYRINGGSTQLEGVKSDIPVVDQYSYIDIGERDQNNPLPWDKISAAYYDIWDGYIDYDKTIEKSRKRMANNPQLKLIDENAKWIKKQRDQKVYSLQIDVYNKETEQKKKKLEYFDKIYKYQTDLSFQSLPYELDLIKKDSILKMRRERWHKSLGKDVYIEEAIEVLKDLQMNNVRKNGLASSVKG
ncbi:MAG: carboxy terminal-processing peptidase [Flavobacteriaceae bacterium]|nr:carboxy terminal-processing peptidase [Flavobacteriaceae bacterium]